MLSSIHPLGERARGNRWSLTVTAFTSGAVLGGAAVGAALGAIGPAIRTDVALRVVGVGALVAGGLDLLGVPAPGPARQVNERWIGALRGTVYGFGFGAQLGTGVATFVVTWGVWLLFVVEFLSGSAVAGGIIGAAFGLGRSVVPLAAGRIDRPSRLTAFTRTLAGLARPAHVATATVVALVGIGALWWGL